MVCDEVMLDSLFLTLTDFDRTLKHRSLGDPLSNLAKTSQSHAPISTLLLMYSSHACSPVSLVTCRQGNLGAWASAAVPAGGKNLC